MLAYAHCLGSMGENVQNIIAQMGVDYLVVGFDGQAIGRDVVEDGAIIYKQHPDKAAPLFKV